jgi:DNA-binding NtrC family response regulator
MCVLLVEDEAIILMDVADALERAGHEVLQATDGAQALEAIRRHCGRFSALVTDQRIPGGIEGSTIATAMRAEYADIPVIIATGNPDEITVEFRSRYRVKVLSKPYHPGLIVRELSAPAK